MKAPVNPNPWDEAKNFGIDISQIVDNLNRSYEERIAKHQQALDLLLVLKSAKENSPHFDTNHSHDE